ncbi:MAG: thioredoxin domain-containing protein, partial [Methylococcaceae bacterium]|nr:thioredoxin domain-containing protein [Methylococcaceae bacterium]
MLIKRLGQFLVCIVFLSIDLNLVQASETDDRLLKKVLAEALAKKSSDYKPNTNHFLANGQPEFTNRLILEDSPYLLQHAHNPVNWYAWGDEAFAAARQQNKPIFLSIGYSTCYWCHVMERESFANKQIAQLLNEHFISIKVDREQRPDIDAVYMAAVTLISGSGGWPMSSFLTPEGKTFIGGGYFSAEKLTHLLEKIHSLWLQQPQLLIQQAEQVRLAVEKQFTNQQQAQVINTKTLTQATEHILSQYDQLNGGFGYQPKFPQEMWLHYLVDFSVRFDHPMALEVAEKSLKAMARGGIYDHIGGGFHRYATDAQWRIPHFEKMLYNQAQLSQLYLRAYQLSGKSEYADVVKATLDYVLSDLVSAEGGFYAAVDAENEAGEGAYFVWTAEEIRQVLPPKLAALAIDLYGVVEQGVFDGKNVLFLRQDLAAYAQQHDVSLAVLVQDVQAIKTQLKQVRTKRGSPFVDHKIIT